MIGQVCVQGGDEFTEPCRAMDEQLLTRLDAGPVLVAPLASASGSAYRTAGARGREYLESVGFADVSVAAEPGVQLDRVVRSIVDARTVVLPGGSPGRIHRRVVGTALGGALRAHMTGGGALIGASAGAMVLGSWMVLPGIDDDVHRGLGVLPGLLVLPHFAHGERTEAHDEMVATARRKLSDDVDVLGLPTCSGVLFDRDADPVGLGIGDCWRFTADGDRHRIPGA